MSEEIQFCSIDNKNTKNSIGFLLVGITICLLVAASKLETENNNKAYKPCCEKCSSP